MRHNKHTHQLGVKKEHRASLMASLASALLRHDRIETTLANAKALRPFVEKMITLAKKAAASEDKAVKLHYRRLAIAKIRDNSAVHFLFDEKVAKFAERKGGYSRIYKLVPRVGDAADMAIIELIEADDKGYSKDAKKSAKKPAAKKAPKAKVAEESVSAEEAPVAEAEEKKAPAKKTATKKAATKKTAKKAAADKAE